LHESFKESKRQLFEPISTGGVMEDIETAEAAITAFLQI
jgi:hypothetical protein